MQHPTVLLVIFSVNICFFLNALCINRLVIIICECLLFFLLFLLFCIVWLFLYRRVKCKFSMTILANDPCKYMHTHTYIFIFICTFCHYHKYVLLCILLFAFNEMKWFLSHCLLIWTEIPLLYSNCKLGSWLLGNV